MFAVNCSRREMLRSCKGASFSPSRQPGPSHPPPKVGGSWCALGGWGVGRTDCKGECCPRDWSAAAGELEGENGEGT